MSMERWAVAMVLLPALLPGTLASAQTTLPDSPGTAAAQAKAQGAGALKMEPAPCTPLPAPSDKIVTEAAPAGPPGGAQSPALPPCPAVNPYSRFLDSTKPLPLTPKQKGVLAIRDVIDPFNLLTVVANSAVTIGVNSHSAYGPGMRGFGKNVGYSVLQDATGEFIGTFAICSLLHEDPHYHRMPSGRPFQRVVHAISRTVIAQHDDGTPMPNWETLITYPASAEISNLYVPGVHGNGPSTVARVATGLATDPVNNLITEFLPDFAKRIHIRIVFVQQLLNNIASGQPM